MKYLVISNNLTNKTYYYENKNCLEEKYLFMAVTLAHPVGYTISTSPVIEESETIQEIQSVAELFGLIGKIAIGEVA